MFKTALDVIALGKQLDRDVRPDLIRMGVKYNSIIHGDSSQSEVNSLPTGILRIFLLKLHLLGLLLRLTAAESNASRIEATAMSIENTFADYWSTLSERYRRLVCEDDLTYAALDAFNSFCVDPSEQNRLTWMENTRKAFSGEDDH